MKARKRREGSDKSKLDQNRKGEGKGDTDTFRLVSLYKRTEPCYAQRVENSDNLNH